MNRNLLIDLYREFFLKSGFFCPVCMRGIQVAIQRSQIAFDIPLAMRGTCRRTEEHISQEFFIPGDLGFIESVLEGSPLYNEAKVLLRPVGILRGPHQIMLPEYIEWNYDDLFRTITEELGWSASSPESEHSDCLAADVVHWIRWKKWPALVPELLRYSKLVSAGIMKKDEARKTMLGNNFRGEEPASLDWFLETLKIGRPEMEEVLADPDEARKILPKESE
jgi:hypothetical protein